MSNKLGCDNAKRREKEWNFDVTVARLLSGWTISRNKEKDTSAATIHCYAVRAGLRYEVCDSATSGLPSKNSLQSRAVERWARHTWARNPVAVRFSRTMQQQQQQQQRGRAKGVRRIPCTRGIHAENSGHVNLGKSYERLSRPRSPPPRPIAALLHSYRRFDSLRGLLFRIFDKVGNSRRKKKKRAWIRVSTVSPVRKPRDISF